MKKIIGIGILGILLFAAFFSSGCIDEAASITQPSYTCEYQCVLESGWFTVYAWTLDEAYEKAERQLAAKCLIYTYKVYRNY